MLSIDSIKKLIGLEDVIVKNIVQHTKSTEIEIELERKTQICPRCGSSTKTIHDYRKQTVKDVPAFGKSVIINLKKRRYRCCLCEKRFIEKIDFLPRYHRMTSRLVAYVLAELASEYSFTSVSKKVNLSVSTVIRIFDFVNYGVPDLPEVLSIDEFKGNTGLDKYQVIITDPVTGRVLDILPSRRYHKLINYFKPMNRCDVKFFVSDMWKPYRELSGSFFKDATQITDKYHFIRQVVWAFEAVRKQEQKKFGKSHRIYFKRSRSLLIRKYDYLTEEEKQQVNVMLYTSVTLSSAYFLKEKFFKAIKAGRKQDVKTLYYEWIQSAANSGIPSFVTCAKTFSNWSESILNSFDYPYTNAFTEGCNNKIKVLKRNAYGYRNFRRFRNRILHMFHNRFLEKQVVSA
jgi:transposase